MSELSVEERVRTNKPASAVAAGSADDAAVAAVRGFNRFYTNVIGLLRGKYLDTPYSLTEARLLFELAQRDTSEVTDLRRTVDIDPGYLSRILATRASYESSQPNSSAYSAPFRWITQPMSPGRGARSR